MTSYPAMPDPRLPGSQGLAREGTFHPSGKRGFRPAICMRTTLDIGDDLLLRAKKTAADQGVPLRQVMEAALQVYLAKKPRGSAYKLSWRTESGRMLPGVRLDDRDALFDLMEGR
jgi:hypothetical protein